jgi:hypothetical protein
MTINLAAASGRPAVGENRGVRAACAGISRITPSKHSHSSAKASENDANTAQASSANFITSSMAIPFGRLSRALLRLARAV